ncbi:hypothetical protein D3C81_138310 [compost metagenome]
MPPVHSARGHLFFQFPVRWYQNTIVASLAATWRLDMRFSTRRYRDELMSDINLPSICAASEQAQSAFIVSRFQFHVPVPLEVESVFCCVKSALILVKLIENESFGMPPPPLQLICEIMALSMT